MVNKISYIENENGEKISPVTSVDSIYTEDGKKLLDALHPVGSIYLSTSSTNPSTYFGGTWERFANGQVLVGVDTQETEFNTVQKTGGSKTHTVTLKDVPAHTHSIPKLSGTAASAGSHKHNDTFAVASNGAHTHRLKGGDGSTDFTGLGEFTNRKTGKEPVQQAGKFIWDGISATTTSAGAHTHTLNGSVSSGGAHTHTVSTNTSTTGSTGSSVSINFNVLQPYITCYIWRRTK